MLAKNTWKKLSRMLQTPSKSTNGETLPQKDKSRFIKFDIVQFYPSTSEELLNRSISFVGSITTISDSVINITHHSRKSLLFDKTSAMLGYDVMMDLKLVSLLDVTC